MSERAGERINLLKIREECGRIFGSGDSVYPTEVGFAADVQALVEVVEAAHGYVVGRKIGPEETPGAWLNIQASAYQRLEEALARFDLDEPT